MKRMQIIRKFVAEMAGRKIAVINDREYCAIFSTQDKSSMIGVPEYNLISELKDINTKIFRRDFVSRYSGARGFANITLVLAHEMGHIKTADIYYFDEAMRDADSQMREAVETQEDYMRIPSEYGATEWAIGWLQDAKNRALAKRFEKEFFGAE